MLTNTEIDKSNTIAQKNELEFELSEKQSDATSKFCLTKAVAGLIVAN